MTTTQKVDYATILSYIDKLGIRIFDFVNHLTKNEQIGSGTSMDVFDGYLTADGNSRVQVALKIPGKVITSRTRDNVVNQVLNDIRQEIRMMKHLEAHPYIINLYGVAFEDFKTVLVVEYALSTLPEHLAQRKKKGNIVGWQTKARICCEIADGLHALHQVNIVHGDVKGDNILLFPDENDQEKLIAKISDFGFSSTRASIYEGRGTGMTPAFCAPECTKSAPAENKHFENEPTKDNYSYGLLVWQIVNDGDEPFSQMNNDEIDKLKHSDKELNFLMNQLDDDAPEEFRVVISGMTHYNPGNRMSFADVRVIMSSDDDIRYIKAKSAFEAAVLDLPRDFGIPVFNSIQLMALSTPIKCKIFRSYEKAASNGDMEAACFLSRCYGSGFGVEIDEKNMVSFAIMAAESGNLEAVKLIASYYDIYSDLRDYAILLFPWVLKVAEVGHQRSIWNVKWCYAYGIGVKHNFEKYKEWDARLSADLGSNFAPNLGSQHSLHHAAHKGSFEIVKFILRYEKPNINLRDDEGRTALHAAAKEGHINVAHILLAEFGADVNVKDIYDQTPLHLAAGSGHIDIIKLLVIEFGAEVNTKDNLGRTQLHYAVSRGHIDIVKLFAIEFGANVNAKENVGWTSLHLAAGRGFIDVFKLLAIEFSADVNANDNYGSTPLHLAIRHGKIDIIKLLATDFKVDMKAIDKYGQRLLHLAARAGHVDIIKLLVIEFGADVNAKTKNHRTALHLATSNGHVDVIKFLVVELGVEVNPKDIYGQTPLHLASRTGHVEAIKLLIDELGADINSIDGKGYTPLELAVEPVHLEVACDGCGEDPIIGERYKCTNCSNIDFCSLCISVVEHTSDHEFKIFELH